MLVANLRSIRKRVVMLEVLLDRASLCFLAKFTLMVPILKYKLRTFQ